MTIWVRLKFVLEELENRIKWSGCRGIKLEEGGTGSWKKLG
jgi:hypothetical protein